MPDPQAAVVVGLTVLAVALAGLPGSARPRLPTRSVAPAWRVLPVAGGWSRRPRRVSFAALASVGAFALLTAPSALVGPVVLGIIGAAAVVTRRSWAAEARQRRTADRVVDLVEGLAADLSIGHAPGAAVRAAALDREDVGPRSRREPLDDVLAELHAADALGLDLAPVWRAQSRVPGCDGLSHVAAAWQVAHVSGASLATVLQAVAEGLRSDAESRRAVAVAVAGARASTWVLAGLPLLGVAIASALGAQPWAFLSATLVGRLCLVAGLALDLAGLVWIGRIGRTGDVRLVQPGQGLRPRVASR